MNWRRFLGKLFAGWQIARGKVQPSFSQAGEDQLIRYLVYNCLGISKPTYLDIGTNHPFICNNTFYFYSRGSQGVCIEPDERFAHLIKQYRKRDVFLHAGVGTGDVKEATLFGFPEPYSGWNTFSREEAEKRQNETGIKYSAHKKLPLISINEVISKYFNPYPNIVSLDVEGLDLEILKSLDFDRYRPEVICVESITFSTNNEEEKISEIADFVVSKGYFVFGDTHVNTIFCRTDAFKR